MHMPAETLGSVSAVYSKKEFPRVSSVHRRRSTELVGIHVNIGEAERRRAQKASGD